MQPPRPGTSRPDKAAAGGSRSSSSSHQRSATQPLPPPSGRHPVTGVVGGSSRSREPVGSHPPSLVPSAGLMPTAAGVYPYGVPSQPATSQQQHVGGAPYGIGVLASAAPPPPYPGHHRPGSLTDSSMHTGKSAAAAALPHAGVKLPEKSIFDLSPEKPSRQDHHRGGATLSSSAAVAYSMASSVAAAASGGYHTAEHQLHLAQQHQQLLHQQMMQQPPPPKYPAELPPLPPSEPPVQLPPPPSEPLPPPSYSKMSGGTTVTTTASHYSSLSDIVKDLQAGQGEIFDPAALLGSEFGGGGAFGGSSKPPARSSGAALGPSAPLPSSHSFQSSQQSLESLLGRLIKQINLPRD